ncbi:MAG: hypothetical protein HFG33_03665 [Bacilli bacterium]|nr:hypothetical protein [Bacilli bacterium]
MIRIIINGLISLIIGLVNTILIPLDFVIGKYLPSLSESFALVNDFFETIGNIVPFCLSYTGIRPEVLSICVDLLVFIYTVPYLVHAIKLAIKWYNSLKL